MLREIDLDQTLTREAYTAQAAPVADTLGALQRQALAAGVPVIILLEGWHGSGKGMLLNYLSQTLDPRGFRLHTTSEPTDEEKKRPFLWQFWSQLPARGQIAVYDTSWYHHAITAAAKDDAARDRLAGHCREIAAFEQMLIDDGYVIIKLFLHIGKHEQQERLNALAEDRRQAWRLDDKAWKQNKHYQKYRKLYDRLLAETSSDDAPWTVIPAHDRRVVRLRTAAAVIAALQNRLSAAGTPAAEPALPPAESPAPVGKPGCQYSEDEYHRALAKCQAKLRRLQLDVYRRGLPTIIVFEGSDAAGKGGTIHRLCHSLDPRAYRVVPIAGPDQVEKQHHYLWRFWREFPAAGHLAVFDRSWYGRVLVERVEGFASQAEWQRAYREIHAMERYLSEQGTLILKFWLAIDQDEQLKRFRERQEDPAKRWKITDEDWRNRAKWPEYTAALDDMLRRTHAPYAPWHVIDANNQQAARLEVLQQVIAAWSAATGDQ
jgi:polyphosphate:AMP phosphotransferase